MIDTDDHTDLDVILLWTDWMSTQGSVYKIANSEEVIWDTANQHCQDRGAHLLKLETMRENNMIGGILAKNDSEFVFTT